MTACERCGTGARLRDGAHGGCHLLWLALFGLHLLVDPWRKSAACVNGIVVDATEAPIQGAQIELRSSTGTILASSDEQGHFRIAGAENGGTLVVSFPGFATVAREIHVRASAESLHVILTPASGLQRVEVQATVGDLIPAVPNSEYVLSVREHEQHGQPGGR